MILSYRDARTKRFARGERVKQFEPFRRNGRNGAGPFGFGCQPADVGGFPGHRLEKLKADRLGQWSVRINDQWRICFEWFEGASGPSNVEIVDYH